MGVFVGGGGILSTNRVFNFLAKLIKCFESHLWGWGVMLYLFEISKKRATRGRWPWYCCGHMSICQAPKATLCTPKGGGGDFGWCGCLAGWLATGHCCGEAMTTRGNGMGPSWVAGDEWPYR